MDVLADGQWENFFTEKPQPFTREQRRQWLDGMTGVALGSDAFFPFGDNIERAVPGSAGPRPRRWPDRSLRSIQSWIEYTLV
mgnify:CR=1 FL=1